MLRAAGADLVLLLAVLHPARRLARLVERALEIGLEPLVEVHDARELERALAIGRAVDRAQQPRPAHARGRRRRRPRDCASSSRTIGSSSPNRGCASRRIVARWRALGFDGALVGEALVRATDPAAAVRAFVAAGAAPDDPANVARRPSVKICGITDADGVLAAVARRGGRDRAERRPGHAARAVARRGGGSRAAGADCRRAGGRPLVVAVTADASARPSNAIVAAVDPDVVQLSGTESIDGGPGGRPPDLEGAPPARRRARRPVGRRRRPRRRAAVPSSMPASSGSSSIPPAGRIPAGPGLAPPSAWPPRSPGKCRSPWPAASTRPTSRAPLRAIPAVGVDVASGVERPARRRPAPDQGSVPRRALRQARPRGPRRPPERRRSVRRRSMPASSTPTAPAGGGWSAISVAATSRRR